jgi:hypothetical protein
MHGFAAIPYLYAPGPAYRPHAAQGAQMTRVESLREAQWQISVHWAQPLTVQDTAAFEAVLHTGPHA